MFYLWLFNLDLEAYFWRFFSVGVCKGGRAAVVERATELMKRGSVDSMDVTLNQKQRHDVSDCVAAVTQLTNISPTPSRWDDPPHDMSFQRKFCCGADVCRTYVRYVGKDKNNPVETCVNSAKAYVVCVCVCVCCAVCLSVVQPRPKNTKYCSSVIVQKAMWCLIMASKPFERPWGNSMLTLKRTVILHTFKHSGSKFQVSNLRNITGKLKNNVRTSKTTRDNKRHRF